MDGFTAALLYCCSLSYFQWSSPTLWVSVQVCLLEASEQGIALHFYKYLWDTQLMNSLAEVQSWVTEQSLKRSWVYRWDACMCKCAPAERAKGRKASQQSRTNFSPGAVPHATLHMQIISLLCMCRYKLRICVYISPNAHVVPACSCLHGCIHMPLSMHVHTSADNEARHICVIHIPPHDRSCSVPERRSKDPARMASPHTCMEWTMLFGS